MSHSSAPTQARPSFGPWLAVPFSVLVAALIPLAGIPALAVTAYYAHRHGAAAARIVALGLLVLLIALLLVFSGLGGSTSGGFTSR